MSTYKLDDKYINDVPVISIAGKNYPVNNRKSTISKMQKAIENMKEGQDEIELLVSHILGAEAAKDIMKLDLPVPALQELAVIIRAAVEGVDYEVAKKRYFRDGQ